MDYVHYWEVGVPIGLAAPGARHHRYATDSTFCAKDRIHRIATKAEGLLYETYQEIGVAIFRPEEIAFVAEFA
jgi:hypothetical protein